jgi:hypothetical protein
VVKVHDDRFGCLSAVSNEVIIEFFDVCGVNAFAHNLVDNDGFGCFVFPVLLTLEILIGHDLQKWWA